MLGCVLRIKACFKRSQSRSHLQLVEPPTMGGGGQHRRKCLCWKPLSSLMNRDGGTQQTEWGGGFIQTGAGSLKKATPRSAAFPCARNPGRTARRILPRAEDLRLRGPDGGLRPHRDGLRLVAPLVALAPALPVPFARPLPVALRSARPRQRAGGARNATWYEGGKEGGDTNRTCRVEPPDQQLHLRKINSKSKQTSSSPARMGAGPDFEGSG